MNENRVCMKNHTRSKWTCKGKRNGWHKGINKHENDREYDNKENQIRKINLVVSETNFEVYRFKKKCNFHKFTQNQFRRREEEIIF